MDGNVIAEFEAIKVAARVVGINNAETITKCCKGARPSAGGYKWRYATKSDIQQYSNLLTT